MRIVPDIADRKKLTMMKLRPHHMLDMLAGLGQGREFTETADGHAQHTVAAAILADPDTIVEWICTGPDTICLPCVSLEPDGTCNRVLTDQDPPLVFKVYNDALDRQLLDYLGLAHGQTLSVREFCQLIVAHSPGIGEECAHAAQNPAEKLANIHKSLPRFGVTAPPG